MKRRIAVILYMLICVSAYSQQQSAPRLPEFKVTVPDGPVVQGDRIEIVYYMDTVNYTFSSFGGVEHGRFESISTDFESIEGTPGAVRKRIIARYRVMGTGQLKVSAMRAVIDSVTVLSDTAVIDVLPNPEYGNQWKVAYDFLTARNIKASNLLYKFGTEVLTAFSDEENKCFAVVAADGYSQYMTNPVLAYGTGNWLHGVENTDTENTIYDILDRYEEQLRQLRKRQQVYSSLSRLSYKPAHDSVEPLLGDIAFGQDYPYNINFPKEKFGAAEIVCLAGCGPVALAQVLQYHSHPVELTGLTTVTTQSGNDFKVDMRKYPVNWTRSRDDVAALMIDCAGSIDAEVGLFYSASHVDNFKSALINYWGFSPQATLVLDHDDSKTLALIYKEIDNGRPVIVSDDSHIFVCDGYYEDYLHYNMGWNGTCNGYYRAVIVPQVRTGQLPYRSVLTGIMPMGRKRSETVHVETPGTLSTLLSADAQKNITSLTVTGTIDGDDISCLRRMAGAIESGNYERGHGSLMNLDLSGCTIKGGKSYLTRSTEGMTIMGNYKEGSLRVEYNYDLTYISDSDWRNIVRHGLDRHSDRIFTRGSDKKGLVSYIAQDNTIGDHMFENCDNLVTIKLPKRVRKIQSYAFYGCRSLKNVENKPSNVSTNAFLGCRFLE